MDATIRSEEKFSRLSVAYEGVEEGKLVCSSVDAILARHSLTPETYTCNISEHKNVLVVEFSDDIDREVGAIFDEILHTLNIKVID